MSVRMNEERMLPKTFHRALQLEFIKSVLADVSDRNKLFCDKMYLTVSGVTLELSASNETASDMVSSSVVNFFLIVFTSNIILSPVKTILRCTSLVHRTLYTFVDGCAKNWWMVAATSVATTLAPTEVTARVVQSIIYSFIQYPLLT